MITKVINSLSFAFKGLVTTWREEHNFRIEVVSSLVVIFCLFYFKFSYVESALCVLTIAVVLSAEIINTVIEDLCNKIEPSYDPIIAKLKDTSGAFVLVSGLGAFVVGLIIFIHHFL